MQRAIDKLGQKESWGIITGAGIAVATTIAVIAGDEAMAQRITESWELITVLVGSLLGPAFVSNVARGRQRTEEYIQELKANLPDAEDDPTGRGGDN